MSISILNKCFLREFLNFFKVDVDLTTDGRELKHFIPTPSRPPPSRKPPVAPSRVTPTEGFGNRILSMGGTRECESL